RERSDTLPIVLYVDGFAGRSTCCCCRITCVNRVGSYFLLTSASTRTSTTINVCCLISKWGTPIGTPKVIACICLRIAKAWALLSQQDCPNQSKSDLCSENKLQSDVNNLQLLSQQDCPNQSKYYIIC